MAVDDERRVQRVGRQLVPDHVGVTRQDGRTAVAEMRRHRGAGVHRVGDLRGGGVGMPEGDTYASRDDALDDGRATPGTSAATVTSRM